MVDTYHLAWKYHNITELLFLLLTPFLHFIPTFILFVFNYRVEWRLNASSVSNCPDGSIDAVVEDSGIGIVKYLLLIKRVTLRCQSPIKI